MKSLRFLDRRVGFSVGALGLLLGMVAPAVVPALASAAEITTRSIQMSTSTESATASYKVTFTPATTESNGDVVLWFCSNTPLVGSSCTAPSGLNLASATVTGAGSEAIVTSGSYAGAGANYLVFNGADLASGTPYTVTIGNVTNPDGTNLTGGTFYGRIETFADDTTAKVAGGDTANTGTANGLGTASMIDSGSVALSLSNSIGVQASVLESLTFCVFGDPGNVSGGGTANNASNSGSYLGTTLGALTHSTVTNYGPGSDCSDAGAGTAAGGSYATAGSVPANVTLGQYVANNIYALDTGHVSYANDWAQLSTNASSGGDVYLQSSNSCTGGGLSVGTGASCGIPAASGSLTAGTAGFGVALGTPVNLDSTTTDDGAITLGATYNDAGTPQYALGSGTNSAYGASFFTTGGAPATNWDVPIGIGASIANNTAAGNYKDSLNLVAVGTF